MSKFMVGDRVITIPGAYMPPEWLGKTGIVVSQKKLYRSEETYDNKVVFDDPPASWKAMIEKKEQHAVTFEDKYLSLVGEVDPNEEL